MPLSKQQLATMHFLANDRRVRALSPSATMVYIQLVALTDAFGAANPQARGEDWPGTAMLARACGVGPDVFAAAVAEMTSAGLYQDEGEGGFALVLPQ